MTTIMNTQMEPSPQDYPILWGKKICMSSLDMDHRQFDITHEDRYQYQQTLIQSTPTNKSTHNNDNIGTKTLQ